MRPSRMTMGPAWVRKARARRSVSNLSQSSLANPEQGIVATGAKSEATDRRAFKVFERSARHSVGVLCLSLAPSLKAFKVQGPPGAPSLPLSLSVIQE